MPLTHGDCSWTAGHTSTLPSGNVSGLLLVQVQRDAPFVAGLAPTQAAQVQESYDTSETTASVQSVGGESHMVSVC